MNNRAICHIAKSKVISFESYHPDAHTHTHTHKRSVALGGPLKWSETELRNAHIVTAIDRIRWCMHTWYMFAFNALFDTVGWATWALGRASGL